MTTAQDVQRVLLEALETELKCPTTNDNAVFELCNLLTEISRRIERQGAHQEGYNGL